MNTSELAELINLLTQSIELVDTRRSTAFDSSEPEECRRWLLRRDHLREARSAVFSIISDLSLEEDEI